MKPQPKIIDATKPFKIAIRREDIAKANPGDDTSCALAQAMLRQRGVEAVSIGATSALVKRADGKTYRYRLAKETQAFIRAFDDSTIFPTVTATLLPPRVKLGDRAGTKPGTDRRSGKGATVAQHLERAASRHVHRPAQ